MARRKRNSGETAEDAAEDQRSAAVIAAREAEVEREERDAATGRFTTGNPHRFLPGQSGNLNGRPKGVTGLFREVAESVHPGDSEGRAVLLLIAQGLAQRAIRGNTQAAREFIDRAYGRVPLALKLGPDESEGPSDIRIRIVGRDDIDRTALRMPAKNAPALETAGGNGNGNGNGDRG